MRATGAKALPFRQRLAEEDARERRADRAADLVEWGICDSWRRMLSGSLMCYREDEVLDVFPAAALWLAHLPRRPSSESGWLQPGVLYRVIYNLAGEHGSAWVCGRFRRLTSPEGFCRVGGSRDMSQPSVILSRTHQGRRRSGRRGPL